MSKSPKPFVVVNKAYYMKSLYVNTIQSANVESNVNTSAKEAIGSKLISRVGPSGSFASEKVNPNVSEDEKVSIDKSICGLVATILKEARSGNVSDVTTSLAQSEHPSKTTPENPIGGYDNDFISSESNKVVPLNNHVSVKTEEKQDVSGEEENPGRRKEKPTIIVNVDEMNSDEEHIAKNLASGITKRLKNRIGKVVMNEDTAFKTVKKKVLVGLTKSWSKVVDPTRKRKEVSSSESDYDVEHDVQDITPQKKTVVRKILVNVSGVPLDNISFHFVNNVDKWKFVYQRRLDLERELGQDAFEFKEFMKLIEHAGLMKSVTGFGKFSEVLVKEFIRNIPTNCDDNKSKEFRKVFMRGKCLEFSPNVINRYMGRCEDEQPGIKVIGNKVCKEIATKQVARPRKGKLSARKLIVKYEMLHMIGVAN